MSDEDNNETNQEGEAGDEGHYVARCRGLPWSTTVDEIKNFFSNCRFKEGNQFSLFLWHIQVFLIAIWLVP